MPKEEPVEPVFAPPMDGVEVTEFDATADSGQVQAPFEEYPSSFAPADETIHEAPASRETESLEPELVSSFEIPPAPETMKRAWFPPPPASPTVPLFVPSLAVAGTAAATNDAILGLEPGTRPLLALRARRQEAEVEEQSPLPARPELRRPTPSLSHLARAEQPVGVGFWLLLIFVLFVFMGVLGYFVLSPWLAHPVGRGAVALNGPALPVAFVVAQRDNPVSELPVSGTVEPSRETAIYARTTGYVRDWLVDIGDQVKSGEVLAELDTPEVDHQLVQARAASDQAKASLALAQNEADRWTGMVQAHAVSQQDADARIAARNEAQANFDAAEANVGRLVDMENFKEIRAPYAGKITARNLEVGTLVGTGPGPAGSELFRLIETDPVRIFVDVPDANAPAIHRGVAAKLQVAAYPNRTYSGAVVRDAGALDPKTHALRTEVRVANPDGSLMPGTTASVRLLLISAQPALLVPASTLIATAAGKSVARLLPLDGREVVRLTPVEIGRDFGSEVEVLANLHDGDRLVANPPADLKDGTVVDARPLEAAIASPSLLPPHPSAPRA